VSLSRPWRRASKATVRRSPRETALAEWHRVDLSALERERAWTPKSAAKVVSATVERFGLARRRSEDEILKVWNDLLDPTLTAHAQPTALQRGTLFVTVDSSVWLDEIVRYRRKEILSRLQSAFGQETIVRLSFRTG
jgi:predicted nucleic acid-binding Zn ribbon protein